MPVGEATEDCLCPLCLRERGGFAVRTVGRQRVEHIGDGEHPGADRDLLTGETIGVSAAVPVLVMGADDGRRGGEERDHLINNATASNPAAEAPRIGQAFTPR